MLYLHSNAWCHVTVVPLPVSTSMNRVAVLVGKLAYAVSVTSWSAILSSSPRLWNACPGWACYSPTRLPKMPWQAFKARATHSKPLQLQNKLFRSLSSPKICFSQCSTQSAILGRIELYLLYKVLRPQFKSYNKLTCHNSKIEKSYVQIKIQIAIFN
jgi:hypothetical protein